MGATLGQAGDTELVQSTLRRDVEVVRRYGIAHPDTWTGVRFDNDPSVRIVAWFTRDLAVHRAALRRVVEHPDRLVLEQSR